MDLPAIENLDAVINIDKNEESIKNNDVKLEENPFEQKKRKRTSMIWNDFNEIILPSGTKKVQCIHCLKDLPIVIMVQQHNTIGNWKVV